MMQLFTLAAALSFGSPQPSLSEAIALYEAGLNARDDAAEARPYFLQAARHYATLFEYRMRGPITCRKMGNAYLLAGELPNAIASYRRGLQFDSVDDELHEALRYSRDRVNYPPKGELEAQCRPTRHLSVFDRRPERNWVAVAATIYLLGCLALARAWMTRRRLWIWSGSALFVGGLAFFGWIWFETQEREELYRQPVAVAAENDATLHLGNGPHYPLRLPDKLPPGVEMRVLAERGGWLQVQLAGGAIGWIDKRNVIMVE